MVNCATEQQRAGAHVPAETEASRLSERSHADTAVAQTVLTVTDVRRSSLHTRLTTIFPRLSRRPLPLLPGVRSVADEAGLSLHLPFHRLQAEGPFMTSEQVTQ